eukprot:3418682-Pyramimonas_sp.AAC.1
MQDPSSELLEPWNDLTSVNWAICSPNYGSDRPKWLGPISFKYPSYLKGEVAGDYGFDPLGFSKEPEAFARNYNAEVCSNF